MGKKTVNDVMIPEWMKIPTTLDKYDPITTRYLIGIDESGNVSGSKATISKIKKGIEISDTERYLTLCAVLLSSSGYQNFRNKIKIIKEKYWPPFGRYNDQYVVLHSSRIHVKKEPFNISEKNYESFIDDLSFIIEKAKFALCYINIVLIYFVKYAEENNINDIDIYAWMLSHLINAINEKIDQKSIFILECRDCKGKKDKYTLKTIAEQIKNDNEKYNLIQGIYFNQKTRDLGGSAYNITELADLCASPINKQFKRIKSNIESSERKDYALLKSKIFIGIDFE